MKIAVASEQDKVAGHFGHCINFNIYEARGSEIINSESIPNPGHKPGFLPNFLNDLGSMWLSRAEWAAGQSTFLTRRASR